MEIERLEDLADTGPDWSISRLQTIMTCGKKYHFKYIDKVPEQPTVPLAFGSAVHKCIEQMHLMEKWTESEIQRMWNDEWYAAQQDIDWSQTFYKKHLQDAKGLKILDAYRDKHQEDNWYALEAHFRFAPGDNYPILRGTFDKIQRLAEGIDTPKELVGRLAIVDYKTSKNPPDALMLGVDPQLTIYHRAALDLLGEDVVLGLHHLPSDTIYWTTRTESSMDSVYDMLSEGYERVEQKKFKRNIHWGCRYCPYKDECLSNIES